MVGEPIRSTRVVAFFGEGFYPTGGVVTKASRTYETPEPTQTPRIGLRHLLGRLCLAW